MSFAQRVAKLPLLGIGVSTEYGAFSTGNGLDIRALRTQHPEFAGFLEVGVEVQRGIDDATEHWLSEGLPVTYHFLDINLEEDYERDWHWATCTRQLLERLNPAWVCGDAGLWHIGPRERGSMTLLPPILAPDAVAPLADGIARLRELAKLEVFPENPPGHFFLGEMHLLDFFGKVIETADTGMLLDCAHLAIYQRFKGHAPLTGLDGFPLDRIVELHVAGAVVGEVDGWSFVEDDHTPEALPETWEILEYVVPRAPNLRAIVFECERNPLDTTLEGFRRIHRIWNPGGNTL